MKPSFGLNVIPKLLLSLVVGVMAVCTVCWPSANGGAAQGARDGDDGPCFEIALVEQLEERGGYEGLDESASAVQQLEDDFARTCAPRLRRALYALAHTSLKLCNYGKDVLPKDVTADCPLSAERAVRRYAGIAVQERHIQKNVQKMLWHAAILQVRAGNLEAAEQLLAEAIVRRAELHPKGDVGMQQSIGEQLLEVKARQGDEKGFELWYQMLVHKGYAPFRKRFDAKVDELRSKHLEEPAVDAGE